MGEENKGGRVMVEPWELHLRAIRRAVVAVAPDAEFQSLLLSEDLAAQICPDLAFKLENGTVTFEGVPLKIDSTLPKNTAIYVPKEAA